MPSTVVKPPALGELGHASASAALGGFVWDPSEEAAQFSWPTSVRTVDRMRRTDAQIRATFQAITLPLRRDIWALDPEDSPQNVVSQLSEDLDLPVLGQEPVKKARRRGRFSWAEHLRIALLSLAYGHLPFEIVWEEYTKGDKTRRLKKLAPRLPQTIAAIDVAPDGGLIGIKQWPLGTYGQGFGAYIPIPVERLVFYCNDREGGAWQGVSLFRACYRDFLLKDRLIRMQAMSIERTGMGIPIISVPENCSPDQVRELHAMAANYRAGESAGGALPYGATLQLVGITGSIPDALNAINYHDAAIAKSMLAQFLQLGTTHSASGNRSLGEAQMDFFTLALDAYAGNIADTTTQHVVEDYVDANFGSNVAAPRVVARAVDADVDIPPEVIAHLIQSGAITMDDTLETWLRERYAMPAPDGTGVSKTSVPVDQTTTTPAVTPDVTAKRRKPSKPYRAVQASLLDAPADDWATRIRDALSALVDPQAILDARAAGSTPAGAVAAGLPDSPGMLPAVLSSLLTSAYGHGTLVASQKLPVKAAFHVPGITRLGKLLSDTGERAGKMVQTLANRLEKALTRGEAEAMSPTSLVDLLSSVGADIGNAGVIAVTETRRAIVSASLDTYAANGIEQTQWVRNSDADSNCDCAANDGQIDAWTEDDCPNHANCGCELIPVAPQEAAA